MKSLNGSILEHKSNLDDLYMRYPCSAYVPFFGSSVGIKNNKFINL